MRNQIITKDGVEHLDVDKIQVEFNIGGASVHLNNLFNGDSELGQAMNAFLNDNWREITAEIRPALAESIERILREMAKRMYDLYPVNQLLPE